MPATAPLPFRWDDVRLLLAVLRSGSFTKAAQVLAVEQSTVSRRITALEEDLGVALFERTGRATVPTEGALALREIAERIEAEMGRLSDAARDEIQNVVSGRVRLALTEETASFFVIPHVLPALRAEYPDLFIDFVTSYRAADLMGHEADIALRFFRSSRGDLIGKKLGELPTGILCRRDQVRILRRRSIEKLPWITVELSGMPTLETQWLDALGAPAPVLTCSSYHVQLEAIRAGLGVGIGPRVAARLDRDFAEIAYRSVELPRLELYLFTRRAIHPLPRIRVVLEALEKGLRPFLERGRG